MKSIPKLATSILLTVVLFIDCKKENTNPQIPINKPPIANAGPDQVFAAPPASIVLDGSASTDPDGGGLTYQWSRISGPVSIWIANNNTQVTEIRSVNLGHQIEIGIYEFELKVTDNNGQSASDRVVITVNRKTIYVSTINELYSAVNDTTNAGALIILAQGTYTLNAGFPNGGRLELQPNMELRGQPDHPELVVIDESALPTASFVLASAGRSGGIRIGSGTNTLRWLTIKGDSSSANPLSVIDTDLSSVETHIEIFHVNIIGNGSSIGIDIRSRRTEQSGRIIEATLENNDITGVITYLGPAIEIQNANGVSGSFIKVNMKQNYLHGNKTGIGAFNNAATATVNNSRIEITSNADKIEGNGVGLYMGGGISQVATASGNGNSTTANFYGSLIRYNNPVPLPPPLHPDVGASYTPCGIYTFGGMSVTDGGYNKTSNNTLKLNFWDCDISNNNSPDINVYGAWCPPLATLAGTNNLVEIYLNGISANANDVTTPSVPIEPAGTNVVSIFR